MSEPLDLDAIAARMEIVTAGPWEVVRSAGNDLTINGHVAILPTNDKPPVAYCMDRIDATFMAAARTDVPALINEVRELRAQVESQEAELQRMRGQAAVLVDALETVEAMCDTDPAIYDIRNVASFALVKPAAQTCWICHKSKGQPPGRCPGHYMGTESYPTKEAQVQGGVSDRDRLDWLETMAIDVRDANGGLLFFRSDGASPLRKYIDDVRDHLASRATQETKR
jgi:hypothetical protein